MRLHGTKSISQVFRYENAVASLANKLNEEASSELAGLFLAKL
jgi:hypothetical protein